MSTEELIEAWLDNGLDESGQADLERQLHDPSKAEQLVRAAHFRHSLRCLVAQRRQGGGHQDAVPVASRPPAWRWGIAACLGVGLAIWLLLARLPSQADRPSLQGRQIASAELVETASLPGELRWQDGSCVELAPGSALTVAAGPGKRLELQRGSLRAMVTRQPAAAPLVVSANGCIATTSDGIFSFTLAPAAASLSVVQGDVRLVRANDGFRAAVEAGGLCILPLSGIPHVRSPGFAITPLDDAANPASRIALGGAADSCRLTTEPGVDSVAAARVVGTYAAGPVHEVDPFAKSWILLRLAPMQGTWDLSANDGIEFWFRGPGSGTGGRIWIEIVCHDLNVVEPDHETHFEAYVPDAAPGWRLIRLPWSAFTRRVWPERPAGTRLLSARVMQVNVMQLGVRNPDFAVDGLSAWSDHPSAP